MALPRAMRNTEKMENNPKPAWQRAIAIGMWMFARCSGGAACALCQRKGG